MRIQSLLALGLISFSVACAANGTSSGDPNAVNGQNGNKTGDQPADQNQIMPEDDDTPHALGTIVLGEARASATGSSSPVIAASFTPDGKKAEKSCSTRVAGCEMVAVPQCRTGSTTGCTSGELCSFNDSCEAVCVKTCTKSCGAGEECVYTGTTTMACKKKERFDAGAISFSGTTTPITLFPPYAVKPDGNGAPFMAKSEIHVVATGAHESGFQGFDEKFTSTTFLETDPPLADLDPLDIFGKGDVAVGWVAGEDKIVVGVSGTFGTAKCDANDADGKFSIPRDVIDEVLGSSSTSSASLSISVTRQRREIRSDAKPLNAGVEKGYLELITTSSEAASFQSQTCQTGYAMCNSSCINVQNDRYNCGECGNACPSTQYCYSGVCE